MNYPPATTVLNEIFAASQHRRMHHRRIGEMKGMSVRTGIRIHGADEADASIDDPSIFTTASLE
ncbi:hypothetical protein ACWX0K_13845 [Nitrobacteraceae bacterium UC4446_H13]